MTRVARDGQVPGRVRFALFPGLRSLSGYTAFNLPTQITGNGNTLTYTYGPAHERVKEESSARGTTYMFGAYELHVGPCTKNCTAGTNTTVTEQRHILPAGLGVVTLDGAWTPFNGATINAPPADAYRFFHKDHLGSVVAITDGNGTIKQRIKYDVWGTRSSVSLTGDPYLEERGFTGHEHLDEVGFIHMNGRIYDPTIGRFLQADPIIQDASDGQGFNRYSYVINNPLSLTDPSGFSWWTKWRRTIFSIVAAVLIPMAVGSLLSNAGLMSLTTVNEFGAIVQGGLSAGGNAVAAIAGGFAAGGISGGNLQSAIIGAFTAGLQFGIGEALGHATTTLGATGSNYLAKAAAHAAVGCASAAAAGGSCKAGAMAAGFSSLAGPYLPGGGAEGFHAGNMAGRMIVGAVASKLGGGKYENGALTAAMQYLFNEVEAFFDKRTGQITIRDLDTGKTTTASAFTSGRFPISDGTYDILSFQDSTTKFRLEALDSRYGDDLVQWSGQTELRLHHLGRGGNVGCISATDNSVEWGKIYNSIFGTLASSVDVMTKGWIGGTERLVKYGTITVYSSSLPAPAPVNPRLRN